MNKIILQFLIALLSTPVIASSSLMNIYGTESKYDATEYISFFKDSTLSLSFASISDSNCSSLFRPVKTQFINFGATKNAYWFRFDVVNHSNNNLYFLDIDYAPLNKVTIFLQDERGYTDTLLHSGLDFPGNYFMQDRSSHNCHLPLEKGKKYRVYIRLQTSSYLLLPISVMSHEALIQKIKTKNRFIFILLGIVFTAFLFNIILFVLTRETTYLLLSISLFLMLIIAFYQYGIEISPTLHPWLKSRMRIFTFGLLLLSINFFIIRYLDLAKYRFFQIVFRILTGIIIIYTSLIILPLLPNVYMNYMSPYISTIMIFIYLITAIFTLLKKNKAAFYLLLYIIGFLISTSIWLLLMNNKIVYNPYTYHVNLLSSSLFGVLLTMGLVEKITAIKKEQEKNEIFQKLNHLLQSEINERKNIEKDLVESNETFRLLFNLSPQPIAFTDYATGRIIDINDKLLQILGYKKNDILNKTKVGLEFIDQSTREKLLSEIREKGVAESIEVSFPTPIKGLMHFLLFSNKITLKGEEKLITSLLDITSLKKSEMEIRKLTTAIEKISSTIMMTNANGEIEYVNEYFTKLTGFSKAEVLGKRSNILKSNFHPDTFYKELWNTIKQGKIWQGEFYNQKKNGDFYWEFATIAPIFDVHGDHILHFVASKHDITENKRQLVTLQQSELKLRELNDTKDKFFSIISHDLMNPFNALLGFSQLLKEALVNNEELTSMEYANYIENSAQNIFILLQDLLLWSRTQSGKMIHNPCMVDIDELTYNSLTLLMPNVVNKKIKIQIDIEVNIKASIDYNMISTVVRNLVMNAIKFTEKEGTITVKANVWNNNLNFSVSDTGIGIDDKHINQLFSLEKPFSSKGTNDEAGTGLGLVICKEFIDIHNGKIWAESFPGKGSTFYFTVPAGLE